MSSGLNKCPLKVRFNSGSGRKERKGKHMEEIALPKLIAQSNKGALALVMPSEIVKRLDLVKGQKVRVLLDGDKTIILQPLEK